MASKKPNPANESTISDAVVTDLVGEVERSQLAETGGSWFKRGITPRNTDSSSRKINELEQQVKILANRPNVFELDDAEIMAIAGEDAALLIRAAKSKAQSVLLEGERSSQTLREEAAKELEKAKKTANRIVKSATSEADLLKQEIEILKLEGEKVMQKAKADAARISSEAERRAKELLTRALRDAEDEKERILADIQTERKRVLARLESQRETAQRAANHATKIRRDIANAAVALKGSLDEAVAGLTDLEQKAEGATERLSRSQEKS